MPLHFKDGTPFAIGSAPYQYRPATSRETYERILLTISIGDLKTSALVDTGGVFFVCSPEIADYIGLDSERGASADRLLLRGRLISGTLHRVEITLEADEGESLSLAVTAFVPRLRAGEEWFEEFPCIMALYGCLERLRFAIDPTTGTFYFG